MDEKDEGFTLIELLVVIIIIGILAAIAIPVFLNQRAKAQDSAAKADVSTIGKELATYYVDNTGNAPVVSISTVAPVGHYVYTPTGGTLTDIGKASSGVAIINEKGTKNVDWCVAVSNNDGSQKYYQYSAQGGLDKSTSAGCP